MHLATMEAVRRRSAGDDLELVGMHREPRRLSTWNAAELHRDARTGAPLSKLRRTSAALASSLRRQ